MSNGPVSVSGSWVRPGMVGTEMLRILEERAFPVSELPRLRVAALARAASCRSAVARCVCEVLRARLLRRARPRHRRRRRSVGRRVGADRGRGRARVVDNSAAFRMDPDVPLVIAEVNPDDLRSLPKGIASCPNCTTMIPVTALAPLHRAARIDRMVVSTYQSVSGAGQVGMHELDAQWTKLAGPQSRSCDARARWVAPIVEGEVWRKPIAGNVIPLAGSVKEQGYTSEEWKMIRETRKILHDDDIRCTVTCVRVPVFVGHAVSANVRFHRPMSKAEAVELAARRARRAAGRRRRRLSRLRSKRPASIRCSSAASGRTVGTRIDQPLDHRRQPAQGCCTQRGADGRGVARGVTGATASGLSRVVRLRSIPCLDISDLASTASLQSLLGTPPPTSATRVLRRERRGSGRAVVAGGAGPEPPRRASDSALFSSISAEAARPARSLRTDCRLRRPTRSTRIPALLQQLAGERRAECGDELRSGVGRHAAYSFNPFDEASWWTDPSSLGATVDATA